MPEPTIEPDGRTLPCGTTVADLLDGVADGEPAGPHADGCPFCRAALRRLTPTWASVRAAAAAPIHTPPTLVPRALARLRAERWAGTGRLVVPGVRGTLALGPRAVVALTRATLGSFSAVRFVDGHYDDGVLGVRLTVRYGASLPSVVTEVRERLIGVFTGGVGAPAPLIDIEIVGVW